VYRIKKLTKAAKVQQRAVDLLIMTIIIIIIIIIIIMIINCPLVIATSVVRFALQSEN
jgi:hypothetical protein